MQMVKKSVVLLIMLPFLVVLLMPKKELYYLLEKKLEMQNIVISGEDIQENLLGLTIAHPTIYLGGAPVATAKDISLWSMIFYTKASIRDLVIAEGLPTAMHVKSFHATHTVLAPLIVTLKGESTLGALQGEVQLKARKLHLTVAKGGENRTLARYLKKSKEGWVYESKF